MVDDVVFCLGLWFLDVRENLEMVAFFSCGQAFLMALLRFFFRAYPLVFER